MDVCFLFPSRRQLSAVLAPSPLLAMLAHCRVDTPYFDVRSVAPGFPPHAQALEETHFFR